MRRFGRRFVWFRHRLNHPADLVLDRSPRVPKRVYFVRSNSGPRRARLRSVSADAAAQLGAGKLGIDKGDHSEARLSVVVRMHTNCNAAQRIVLPALPDDGAGYGQRSHALGTVETDRRQLWLRPDGAVRRLHSIDPDAVAESGVEWIGAAILW